MSLAVHVMGSEVRLCHRCCSKVDHLVEVVSTRFFHLKVFPLEVFSDTVSLAVLLLSFIEHFWVFLSRLTSLESDVARVGWTLGTSIIPQPSFTHWCSASAAHSYSFLPPTVLAVESFFVLLCIALCPHFFSTALSEVIRLYSRYF